MVSKGSFGISEDEKGNLTFTMYINNSGGRSKESLTETLAHEMLLHGAAIDEIVRIYESGGYKAVSEYIKNTKENDHIAIRDNNIKHPGVQEYNNVRKELITKNPNYKQIFDEAKERHKDIYEGRE